MSSDHYVVGDRPSGNRIHGSMYADPLLFEEELARIWKQTWVYVGHESEVPEPNDFVMKCVQPVSSSSRSLKAQDVIVRYAAKPRTYCVRFANDF
jgi:hypothetical protein